MKLIFKNMKTRMNKICNNNKKKKLYMHSFYLDQWMALNYLGKLTKRAKSKVYSKNYFAKKMRIAIILNCRKIN